MRRRWILICLWAISSALAILVGVIAVTLVGATISHRGPLGDAAVPDDALARATQSPDLSAPPVRDSITGEWGSFVVECRDTWAIGIATKPHQDSGWGVVSWENGPDEDVNAVFSDGKSSVSLEVFCNRGRPTLTEVEHNTLGDD